MRLQAAGILAKLKYDVMNPPFAIPYPKMRVNQPISLSQLTTAFIAQAIGLSAALLAFFGEICVAKQREQLIKDQVIEI